MKLRLFASTLLLAILMTPMNVPFLAQSNHTLEWGVELNERFTYVLQRAYYSDNNSKTYIEEQIPFLADLELGEKVIVEVEYLETIEDQINVSSQIPPVTSVMPVSQCILRRANNFSTFMVEQTGFVLPIGDWEFLEEILGYGDPAGLTFVDTEDEWGTIGTGIISGSGGSDINVRVETRYEKENGTLSYLRHRYTTLGNDLIDVIFVHWYPGMPTIIGGGIQTTTLMIIAVSGLTGLVVAFVIYRRIKGRKSVAQMLGE